MSELHLPSWCLEGPGFPAQATRAHRDWSSLHNDPAYQQSVRARRIRRLNGWFQAGANVKAVQP